MNRIQLQLAHHASSAGWLPCNVFVPSSASVSGAKHLVCTVNNTYVLPTDFGKPLAAAAAGQALLAGRGTGHGRGTLFVWHAAILGRSRSCAVTHWM
jgi:hypothetical protein